jgi:hypothetical protein
MAISPPSCSTDFGATSLRGPELFCRLIPEPIAAKFPPDLSPEDRIDYYLNFHTTYPEASKWVADDDLAAERMKIIYKTAHVALALSGNEAQAFYCYPGFLIAYKNLEGKLSCFNWTTRMDDHQLEDLATKTLATLTCCKIGDINHSLCFSSLRATERNLTELKALVQTDTLSTYATRHIVIPDQRITLANLVGKDVLVMGSISMPIDPTIPSSPAQLIENSVVRVFAKGTHFTPKEVEALKEHLIATTTFPAAESSKLQYNSNQLFDIYAEAIYSLRIHHGAPAYFVRIIGTSARSFIAFNHPKLGKMDIIQWSGSTIPKSKETETTTSGTGAFCLAQRVRRLSSPKIYILKNMRGDYRNPLEFPMRGLMQEVSTVTKIRAIHGKIPGLLQPPLIQIPPQPIYGGIPQFLVGARVERNYGTPILVGLPYYTSKKERLLPFLREFANILGVVHFLNTTEFWIHNVYHCDIKSDNILCKEDEETKLPRMTLIDLGHSRSLPEIMVGTTDNLYARFYREQEDVTLLKAQVRLDNRLKCQEIMMAMETNALGRTLREIIGLDPVPDSKETPQRRLVDKANALGMRMNFFIDLYQLTKQMTIPDYEQRISLPRAKEILLQLCAAAE